MCNSLLKKNFRKTVSKSWLNPLTSCSLVVNNAKKLYLTTKVFDHIKKRGISKRQDNIKERTKQVKPSIHGKKYLSTTTYFAEFECIF